MCNYLVLIASYLKWAWNFLHCSFFSNNRLDIPEILQELNLSYYENKEDNPKECAVCLSKIQNGEEIRELRCSHVFHRVCLDRWLGYKSTTCPLCRDLIGPRKTLADAAGIEVLVFKYCSFNSRSDGETWWLR
ncbi:hypothetical protein JCGZ_18248 [Jatropha curcas]|uniref:RING-type domain-containing protein n=1 Tax=Jatropha curcas TaxID=180498 RepID=A0A067JZM6_JATCU|nr:E3 ubiquitin-protein ligase RHA2B [Jatropha curcas]KDP29327.1 hypothetical protein JCGZ_18248 [Jatropha curcas]